MRRKNICAGRCVLSLSVSQAMVNRSLHFCLFIILFAIPDLNLFIMEDATKEARVLRGNNNGATSWPIDGELVSYVLKLLHSVGRGNSSRSNVSILFVSNSLASSIWS